ncbi:MAG: phosphoadenylyl-sulfate reductase [Gammaproteobacteria bacterium]
MSRHSPHPHHERTQTQVSQWQHELPADKPYRILKTALNHYHNIAVSFSGAEDVVLVHMAAQIKPGVRVFTLDTGRLHPETYQFLEKVRDTYDIDLHIAFPNAQEVSALVSRKGLFSFYKEGHHECCQIRKVDPMRKILAPFDAWITGQRKDQSPGSRQEIPIVQLDSTFSTPEHPLVKFNPLANLTSEQVWLYIRSEQIPYNPLHERGFVSIGCQPCTRPILPSQHEREGRWWWETDDTHKECGLHSLNVTPS